MTVLADHISVLERFARSANLERDADRSEPLEGYIVTVRALEVVERIATVAATGPSGGAWSLTGSYGSGKSSLALLLDAALGPATPTREIAWSLIDEASPAVGKSIRQVHRRYQTRDSGFHRGLITANREPLGHTVLRALHAAVLRRYGKLPPASKFRAAPTLRGALEDVATNDPRRTGPSAAAIVDIARCLAENTPLLLVIDEFGKNLEAIRGSSDADPYLLQQLAEAGQGPGLPIFLLTLQHLSFEDYLTGAEGPQRREWAKVQGRFEDIAYVDIAGDRCLAGSANTTLAGLGEVGDGGNIEVLVETTIDDPGIAATLDDIAHAERPATRSMAQTARRLADSLADSTISAVALDAPWFPGSRRPKQAYTFYAQPPTGFVGAAGRVLLADLAGTNLPPGLEEGEFRDAVRSLLAAIPLAETLLEASEDTTLTRADASSWLETVAGDDFTTTDLWIAFVNWMAYFFPDRVIKQEIAEIALRCARLLD